MSYDEEKTDPRIKTPRAQDCDQADRRTENRAERAVTQPIVARELIYQKIKQLESDSAALQHLLNFLPSAYRESFYARELWSRMLS